MNERTTQERVISSLRRVARQYPYGIPTSVFEKVEESLRKATREMPRSSYCHFLVLESEVGAQLEREPGIFLQSAVTKGLKRSLDEVSIVKSEHESFDVGGLDLPEDFLLLSCGVLVENSPPRGRILTAESLTECMTSREKKMHLWQALKTIMEIRES